MKTMRHGSRDWERWLAALPRAGKPDAVVLRGVAAVLRDVRRHGDDALVRLTRRFDQVELTTETLRVPAAEVRASARRAPRDLVRALQAMATRIERFHARQKQPGFRVPLGDGSTLMERVAPLDSAGLYVPGGAGAYPSSVLMSAIPARVAGVRRVVVATPPRALAANPGVAAALVVAGLEGAAVRVGGAQAIAALAYGTKAIEAVAKIVGPGNAWVAEAKRQVRGTVEIDQDAGPSEVAVLADETAAPVLVAADILAQAEHGSGDEVVVLVTTSESLGAAVAELVMMGAAQAANPKATRRALQRFGAVVLVQDVEEGVSAINRLAPEHVQVTVRNAASVARRIVGGAVFVGRFTPVAAGDYGIGPNHVLPTGGSARRTSPLSVRDFERRWSEVRLTRAGLQRAAAGMQTVAMAEGFPAHARSIAVRL